jgi:predicted RNase H-like HicB family nuclease
MIVMQIDQKKQLHVDVYHEDGSYWAEVRELAGGFASGHTVPELIESVEEAIALYLAPEGEGPVPLAAEIAGLAFDRDRPPPFRPLRQTARRPHRSPRVPPDVPASPAEHLLEARSQERHHVRPSRLAGSSPRRASSQNRRHRHVEKLGDFTGAHQLVASQSADRHQRA